MASASSKVPSLAFSPSIFDLWHALRKSPVLPSWDDGFEWGHSTCMPLNSLGPLVDASSMAKYAAPYPQSAPHLTAQPAAPFLSPSVSSSSPVVPTSAGAAPPSLPSSAPSKTRPPRNVGRAPAWSGAAGSRAAGRRDRARGLCRCGPTRSWRSPVTRRGVSTGTPQKKKNPRRPGGGRGAANALPVCC